MMRVCVILLILDSLFVGACCLVTEANCALDPAEPLPSLSRRQRSVSIAEPVLNDYSLSELWYSVSDEKENYRMPDVNAPPQEFQCATKYPVYLQDAFTDLEDNKQMDATVCMIFDSNPCYTDFGIKIRNCGGKYEYQLGSTPAPQSAYCFDSPDIQGIEELVPAPVYTIPGTIEVKVTLQFDVAAPYLKFKCDFSADSAYFYTIDWFVNGQFILGYPARTLVKMDQSSLNEKQLIQRGYKLQITITCGAAVSKAETGIRTSMQSSEDFFAGLKLLTPVVSFAAYGDGGTVVLQQTVPVGCTMPGGKDIACEVVLGMFDPTDAYDCTGSSVAVKNSKSCGKGIGGITKAQSHACDRCWIQIVTMDILGTSQGTYNNKESFTLQLQTSGFNDHKIWDLNFISDIQVHIQDDKIWKGKSCSSVIDPHMSTGDGYQYENQNSGEYILYKHKTYQLEIQEKMRSCNRGYAYCTCSVAIRAGNDVFVINLCGSVKFIGFLTCEQNLLDVRERSSNWYQIYTPIGTYIDVRTFNYGGVMVMNLRVYLSPKDQNSIEGLCGKFDGKTNNDFVLRNGSTVNNGRYPSAFTSSWKVQHFESLLGERTISTPWSKKYTLCVCPKAIINGGNSYRDFETPLCSPSESLICTIEKKHPGKKKNYCNIRNRRSTRNHRAEIKRRFAMAEREPSDKRLLVKRNAMTEEEALSTCSDALLRTNVAGFKDRLPGDNLNITIANCALDVKPFGDTTWISAHEEDLKVIISHENERDVEYAEAHAEEIEEFEDIACPDNCHDHGDCGNGTCTCYDGFYGDTCGIDITKPLILDDVEGGGFCDKSEGYDCHECFMVQTTDLLEGFSCQFSDKKTYLDGNEEILANVTTPGERIDIYQGFCCPPAEPNRRRREASAENPVFTTQYKVAISNDGEHFGNARDVHVFDSTCQEHSNGSGEITFSLKANTCFIEGACAVDGDISTRGFCYVCNGDFDSYNWRTLENTCFIGNSCLTNGTVSPSNRCDVCAANRDQFGWSPGCPKGTGLEPNSHAMMPEVGFWTVLIGLGVSLLVIM